jgi:hypothetical protein
VVCELALVDLFQCRKAADAALLGRTREHANCLLGLEQEDLPQPILLQCRKSVRFRLHVH